MAAEHHKSRPDAAAQWPLSLCREQRRRYLRNADAVAQAFLMSLTWMMVLWLFDGAFYGGGSNMLTNRGGAAAASLTNEPFVAGLSDGKLMLQRCVSCKHWQYYPRPLCKSCSSGELEFSASSGSGHVYSFSRLHVAPTPFYKPLLPYLVVLVDMEEGPRVMGHMANMEGLKIGDPVAFKALSLDQDGPKVVGFEAVSGSLDRA